MEKPTSSACIGSSDVVSVSKAKKPWSTAKSSQCFSSFSSVMVWYADTSIFCANASVLRFSASFCGVSIWSVVCDSASCFSCSGTALTSDPVSRSGPWASLPHSTSRFVGWIALASQSVASATRRVSVLNSMALRKPTSCGPFVGSNSNPSNPISNGTSVFNVTSSRAIFVWSA